MALPKDVFNNPTDVITKRVKKYIAGGAAGDHTVTGIAVVDALIQVFHWPELTEGAPNAWNAPADITSEFRGDTKGITAANTINNTGGTDTSNGLLEVIYEDKSLGRIADAGWVGE